MRDVRSKMYIGFHVKCPLFSSDFDETWIFSTDFRKILKFHEISCSGSRVLPWDRRTDMTKLTVASRNCAKTPTMRREKEPTRCHCMLYCTYDMLNMFRALLCPSSRALDYMCVCLRLWCAVLGCWLSGVRCRAAGCASRKRDAARLSIPLPGRTSCCPAPDPRQPAAKHGTP